MNRAAQQSEKLNPGSLSFIRFYILAFLFFAANSALTIILPLRSEAAGLSQSEIGLMMGAYMFTCMLLRPFAAQLLGRCGPLRVMKGLLVLHAATLLLFMVGGVESYLWLRALQGVATAFFDDDAGGDRGEAGGQGSGARIVNVHIVYDGSFAGHSRAGDPNLGTGKRLLVCADACCSGRITAIVRISSGFAGEHGAK